MGYRTQKMKGEEEEEEEKNICLRIHIMRLFTMYFS
jgi:hypothetical protein